MPIIEGFERRAPAQGSLQVQASANAFGADVGRAVQGAAQPLNEELDFRRQMAERNAANQANQTIAEAEVFYQKRIQDEFSSPDFAQKYGADGGTFSDALSSEVDEYVNQQIESAPNGRTAQLLRQQSVALKKSVVSKALSKQVDASVQYSLSAFDSVKNNYGSLIFENPDAYDDLKARTEGYLNSLPNIPADQRQRLNDNVRSDLAKTAAQGFAKNPKAAAELLKGVQSPSEVMRWDTKTIFSNMIKAESGGKQTGGAGSVAGPSEPTTSTAGAVGAAQVLPSTAKEVVQKNGIPWDEERFKYDKTYNTMLGQLYFEEQVNTFGDVAKAVAAYNAGPGGVRRAISKAEQETGNPDNWHKFVPAETKGYLSKVLGDAQYAMGSTPMVTAFEDRAPVATEPVPTSAPSWYKDLDFADRLQVNSMLETAANRGNAEAKTSLAKDLQAFEELAKRGQMGDTSTLTLERFQDAHGVDSGTAAYEAHTQSVNETVVAMERANNPTSARNLPLGFGDTDLQRDASARRIRDIEAAVTQARKADPIGYEINKGADVQELTFNPEQDASIITARSKLAQQNYDVYGTDYRLLSNAEQVSFGETLMQKNPDQVLDYLTVLQSALPYEDFKAVAYELSAESPAMAVAAQAMAQGVRYGSGERLQNTVQSARKVAQGINLLKEGASPIFEKAFTTKHKQAFTEAIAKDLANPSPMLSAQEITEGYNAVYEAVKAMQATDIARGVVTDPTDIQDKKRMRKYIDAVMGEQVKIGDSQVRAPVGMHPDTFKDKLGSEIKKLMDDQNVADKPYTGFISELTDMYAKNRFGETSVGQLTRTFNIVPVGEGKYRFARRSSILKDGVSKEFYEVDVSQ